VAILGIEPRLNSFGGGIENPHSAPKSSLPASRILSAEYPQRWRELKGKSISGGKTGSQRPRKKENIPKKPGQKNKGPENRIP
jgi:hypothetical protein